VVTTSRCQEQADVFRTKERPKKITFIGNDGREYPFLCKAERRGDLRKDARMMEFGVMVNQLLQNHPDARRWNLEVRTFNVVIFTESCGLLEWVSNTRGMRPIIDDLWKRLRPGVQQSVRELKELFEQSPDAYETYTKQVLPRHPPVFHKWFRMNADPSVWLSKRLIFTRSQALWCMLGYIVGLGDRHGENILIDTESGRMVQVDFDCLFGKGMLLEKPETVPFRLTQNCVAAMGVTGIEGVFRNCCELVMEVLRDRANQQTLLSVLHAFVADPLIEFAGKTAPKGERHDEQRTQQARTTIGDVEKKLNGMVNVGAVVRPRVYKDQESVLSAEERGRGLLGRDRGVGLSVAGQVDELLKAAMCKRNLSEMYVGWQPWM
jgi:serine/threonine-protein kinase ATR